MPNPVKEYYFTFRILFYYKQRQYGNKSQKKGQIDLHSDNTKGQQTAPLSTLCICKLLIKTL